MSDLRKTRQVHVDLREGSDDDVAHCVELWTRIIVDRDGPSVAAEVRHHARAAFARRIVRFAVIGVEPVAFALTLARDEQTALLSRLCVSPAETSRGLGSALVTDAADHARAAGFPRLELDVRETNTRAIALYTRAGLVINSQPWDFDGGDPMLTMSIDLARRS